MLKKITNLFEESTSKIIETKDNIVDIYDEGTNKISKIYKDVYELPEKVKNELFIFLKKEKEDISNKIEKKYSNYVSDKIISNFIHSLLPFPLGLIISEELLFKILTSDFKEFFD